MPGSDRFFSEMLRQRIGGVHMAGATEAIARKLVEQDHQRQRTFGMADANIHVALVVTAALMAFAALSLVLWGVHIGVAFGFVTLWGFAFGMPDGLRSGTARHGRA